MDVDSSNRATEFRTRCTRDWCNVICGAPTASQGYGIDQTRHSDLLLGLKLRVGHSDLYFVILVS